MTLKHPEYARGISSAELIKEAIEFCDTELDSFDGMDFDSDSEVCCQRSNTFIRELARRLETATPAPQPQPLPSQPAEQDDRRAEVEEGLRTALSGMKRCEHDGGFDREIGPIGCMLGDKCVCIGVYPHVAKAVEHVDTLTAKP